MKYKPLLRPSNILLLIALFGASLWALPAFGLPYDPLSRAWLNNPYTQTPNIVHVVIVAADNDRTIPGNLTKRAPETLESLLDASIGEENKTIVALIDSDGSLNQDDTQIQIIHNGVITSVNGLPDPSGNLTTAIAEYNMTDGEQLGGFLKWALNNYTDSATKIVLSYIGHSVFLAPPVPHEDLFEIENTAYFRVQSLPYDGFGFLISKPDGPHIVDAFPHFTDVYPEKALITPHAIRQMLMIGTDNGANPIAVLDLLHCFALSLEAAYEVSNETPYTEMIVGSANYAYFTPSMPGALFTALDATDDAATLATNVMNVYEAEIAQGDSADGNSDDVEHPRSITVIDSTALLGIKQIMDDMSGSLIDLLESEDPSIIDGLERVAEGTPTYDTTYCNEDFARTSADGLRDIGALLQNLATEFGPTSDVGSRALQAYALLEDAIVAKTTANGTPWFATPETPFWTFDQSNMLGISVYADLIGEIDGNTRILSWHSIFYTNETNTNPHPYRLIAGSRSWGELFQIYWERRVTNDSLTLLTAACLTDLPSVTEQGELSVEDITTLSTEHLQAGNSTPVKAIIRTESPLSDSWVTFNVYRDGTHIYTNTIETGPVLTGTYEVESSLPFTPTGGAYDFEVIIDDNQRIVESNEDDNRQFKSALLVPITDDWHMVAFSRATAGDALDTVVASAADSIQLILAFDTATGQWLRYDPTFPLANTLTTVDPTQGLWLRGTQTATLMLTDSYPVSATVGLGDGWNLVGVPVSAATPIGDVLPDDLNGIELILHYEKGEWKTYNPAFPFANTLTHFEPGKAYWIRASQESAFTVNN